MHRFDIASGRETDIERTQNYSREIRMFESPVLAKRKSRGTLNWRRIAIEYRDNAISSEGGAARRRRRDVA